MRMTMRGLSGAEKPNRMRPQTKLMEVTTIIGEKKGCCLQVNVI